jgi:ABC-type uncharacterized transport system permease subunit
MRHTDETHAQPSQYSALNQEGRLWSSILLEMSYSLRFELLMLLFAAIIDVVWLVVKKFRMRTTYESSGNYPEALVDLDCLALILL